MNVFEVKYISNRIHGIRVLNSVRFYRFERDNSRVINHHVSIIGGPLLETKFSISC
jgi:hypothetical protein